jgi:small-conductance mechanosensitive channel
MSNTLLPNLMANLITDLHQDSFIWQLVTGTLSLILAHLITRSTQHFLDARPGQKALAREALRSVYFYLTALALVYFSRALLPGHSHPLLTFMLALLNSAIIIRLAVVMLNQVFAPSGWRDQLIRFIAAGVWIGFALYVSGFLPELLRILDGWEIDLGKQRLSFLSLFKGLLFALSIFLVSLWFARVIQARVMLANEFDINLRIMVSKLTQATLVLLALLLSLAFSGVDLTVLSVFGGALGVGLGLGLQKIASNYVSGFIILLDRSVQLGHQVCIDGHLGQLTKMTARYVVVRDFSGIEAIIPNDTLITSTVVNHTYSDIITRQALTVQVSYQDDLEKALAILLKLASEQPLILPTPQPNAIVNKLADHGVEIELRFWVDNPMDNSALLRSDLLLNIWKAFKAEGLTIPYPKREVFLMPQPDMNRSAEVGTPTGAKQL